MSAGPAWMAPGRARASAFLVVPDADRVLDFARTVFGAEPRARPIRRADGRLWNAEVNIGDSTIMIGEGQGEMARPGFVYVQVPDARATHARALDRGATEIMPVARRFYGADDGGVADMAGNWWWIATQVETLSDDEIAARARAEEAQR